MLALSALSRLDEPLSCEVESSDSLHFEPVVQFESDYPALAAFHGVEPERLVLIEPHTGDPGASGVPAVPWSAEQLAEVADVLAADGWQVAIVGDSCDAGRAGAVLGAMQAGALYLASATTRDSLAALIGDARLILSENADESWIAQISSARGTPLIHVAAAAKAGHDRARALVDAALATLHAQGAAHPGAPFTLHTPALKDAA